MTLHIIIFSIVWPKCHFSNEDESYLKCDMNSSGWNVFLQEILELYFCRILSSISSCWISIRCVFNCLLLLTVNLWSLCFSVKQWTKSNFPYCALTAVTAPLSKLIALSCVITALQPTFLLIPFNFLCEFPQRLTHSCFFELCAAASQMCCSQ